MNITISQIDIANFKGIKEMSIALNEDVTKIAGRNGVGKSTICDSVSYCLFGKDSKGNTQFGLKTRDEEGNEIPHLDHIVMLHLERDGKPWAVISRTLREKWQKPRGSVDEVLTGNVIEYSINGEKVTKADYDKFIFSIAGEDTFRLLTIPSHFSNLHWQEQRSKLASMAGDITNEDVAGGNPLYDELLKELAEQNMEAYRKHLSYQIRELKKKIEEMPVKIETLKKTLPEKLAWEELQKELSAKESEYKRLTDELASIKAGGAENAFRKQLQSRMDFQNKRIEEIRRSKRVLARDDEDRHDMELRDAKANLQSYEDVLANLKRKRTATDQLIDACNEAIKEVASQRTMMSTEWTQMAQQQFVFDSNSAYCPTCHQPLPADQVEDTYKKLREAFNLSKANKKEKLLNRAKELDKQENEAKQNKEEYIEQLANTDELIRTTTATIKDAKDALKKIEEQHVPTADELLAQDNNYQSILNAMQKLQSDYDNDVVTDNSEVIANMNTSIRDVSLAIGELKAKLASQTLYNKVEKMIADTEDEWHTLAQQLTALEQKEDVAISFTDRYNSMLENKVNSLFEITKFKLFKTQVDGITKDPWCTATFNGIEYRDLNSAKKIDVGLDIINTLCKFYDVYVPICIDNSEGHNCIPHTQSQQIQFYVTNDNTLTIL